LPAASSSRLSDPTSSSEFAGSYRALDFRFDLCTRLESVARTAAELLAPFRTAPAAGAPAYEIVDDHQPWARFAAYFEGRPVREHDSLEPVLDYLFWHINREAIDSVTSRLAVHAAAASLGERGVLMPAPMGSGKSTLVAGLVRAGFSYLTDEAACFDPTTGLLHPYPKPIWLAPASVEAFPGLLEKLASDRRPRLGSRYQVRPEQLSEAPTGGPCRVGCVIAPSYEAGSRTRLEPMSKAEAVLTVAQSCFNLRGFGGAGLTLLADMVKNADCYRLRMRDVSSAVQAVTEVVARGEESF
jgi:hypothetical protein